MYSSIFSLYTILFFFILNCIFFFNLRFISKKIRIFDEPDNKLKKHKIKVSLLGGTFIFVNVSLFFLINFFSKDSIIDLTNEEIITFLLILFSFYVIGIYDDIKRIMPNFKLLLIILSTLIITYLYPDSKIDILKVTFFEHDYNFDEYSIPFTILSFALLANALNMFDGINLQLILFSIFTFLIFIFKGIFLNFSLIILVCLFSLLILNYKNKIFLGDSGAFIISGILGFILINQYNNNPSFFKSDEIFIILMVPGIDMLRLFIFRIYKKTNPFRGDLKHLHHLIKNRFKNIILVNLIIALFYIIPFILLLSGVKTYLILLIYCLIYSYSVIHLLKKNNAF